MHETAINNVYALIVLACLILSGCGLQNSEQNKHAEKHEALLPPQKSEKVTYPSTAPIVKIDKRPKSKQVNQQWIELLHQSDSETDWRTIEHQNTLKKLANKKGSDARFTGTVEIDGGKLIGTWEEMGPSNLSGDIKRVAYSKNQNRLYAISAGNTLYRGKLDGSEWTVIDDTRRFDYDVLEVVDLSDGGTRILSSINNVPHYSEDGVLWSQATGFDQYSQTQEMVYTAENDIFVLTKQSGLGNVKLMRSTGGTNSAGKTFQLVKEFNTSNFGDLNLALNQDKTNLFLVELIESQSKINTYFWSRTQNQLLLTSTYNNASFNHFTEGKAMLSAETQGGTVFLTIVGKNKRAYRSESSGSIDQIGNSWIPIANLKEKTWWDASCVTESGIYFHGREECYYSIDQAYSWRKVNLWTEYYEDPINNLHIDIMQIREFKKSNGTNFIIICTHGGIYYTENIENGVTNISMSGLNVSQLYDVVTVPNDPNWIFSGSQDQGWQKGRIGSDPTPVEFDQIYHGDYGHILINEDYRLWISYPNGLVRFYNNAFSPFPDTGENIPDGEFSIQNYQKEVWISPMIPHPTNKNAILVAGGSLSSNNDGSYIIRLLRTSNIIEPFPLPFDFSVSGGEISAMATDPNDIDKWYVATTNGKFYHSSDAGNNFSLSAPSVPGGNNLYGSDIMVSKVNPGTLYVAGSGYSNSPVLKSTDGGLTFTSMSEGLPPTTVFELATNEQENLIFAAAEAGAFVYLRATDQWYDLSQLVAPNQRYWSVQYIEEIETARFGTYGRGVWDFTIDQLLSNKKILAERPKVELYPNPSSESIRIDTDIFGNISYYEVYTLDGNFIFGGEIKTPQDDIPVSTLVSGAYVVRLKHSEGYIFKKIVKI